MAWLRASGNGPRYRLARAEEPVRPDRARDGTGTLGRYGIRSI